MSTLLSRPVLDNPGECNQSFASTAFIDSVDAELEAEAAHYLSWQVREAEPAPLTEESAIDMLDEIFPGNTGVSAHRELTRMSECDGQTKVTYSVAVHLPGLGVIIGYRKSDLESAIAEVVKDATARQRAA